MKKLIASLGIVGLVATGGVFAPLAGADHAGEKVTVDKTEGLKDGDSVNVTFSGFDPAGAEVKVVTTGQGELVTIPDKLNFDEYGSAAKVAVGPDGSGSFADVPIYADHGIGQDGEPINCLNQQCWIVVVQEPFLPQPNYNSVPIYFEGGVSQPEDTTDETPETTASPATTEAVVEETTTTTAVEETTTTEAKVDETDAVDEDEDEGGSGLIIGIVAAVVALAAGGGFLATRRKGEGDDEL